MAYEDTRNETLTQTVGRVIDDVRELFREEVALAKAELRHEASEFGSAVTRMGMGAGAAVFALGFLLLGIAQGFAMLVSWPVWGGYLAMGILLSIVGAGAVMSGRSKARRVPAMPKTVESIKETKEWMNDRMSSNNK
jgi:hypothetical protein